MTGQLTPAKAPAVASITDDLERIAIGMVGLTTRALAHAESDLELTFPQWRAILVVGADTDGARIGEVAARVGGTIPATSRLLRRLERRGLVTLATDDADRQGDARAADRARSGDPRGDPVAPPWRARDGRREAAGRPTGSISASVSA